MKHIVIGTAGHVDHGKTQLVKSLTGKETDRLKEEKERGISIELGFAPLTLPNGQKIAIIDVPGHEKFIKHMLAGVGGIDLVLFIIAADEGVMPQTKEHLDIIKLLDIKKGIVVITKIDLVDEEWLELIREEIKEVLIGTPLEKAPMINVSAIKRIGINELLNIIEAIVMETEKPQTFGKSKMSIDRVFSITGFGTVVTGTLTAGKFRLGDTLEILPEGIEVKVRSLQVHGEKVEEALAGQRVAVNISGVEVQEVNRGSVLAEVRALKLSYRLDCQLELLKDAAKELSDRTRIRIHLGTKEALGRLLLLDREELKPGEKAFVQLLLEEPLVADKKDKFVIRTYSPMITIGGGVVIDPVPVRHKRYSEQTLISLATKLKGTPEELIAQFLNQEKNLCHSEEINKNLSLNQEEFEKGLELLKQSQQVKTINIDGKNHFTLTSIYEEWINKISNNLRDFHSKYPLRIGASKEEIRSKLFSFLNNKQFNHLLQAMAEDNKITITENTIASASFHLKPLEGESQVLKNIEKNILESEFQPPSWEEIKTKYSLQDAKSEEYQQYFLEQGILVKVGELLFHEKIIAKGKDLIVDYLKNKGEITLGEARDLFNTSRKYMLPILEYFDRQKVTRRLEDKRVLFKVR